MWALIRHDSLGSAVVPSAAVPAYKARGFDVVRESESQAELEADLAPPDDVTAPDTTIKRRRSPRRTR